WVFSLGTHAVNEFVALFALGQQLVALLRWVLQVAIHLDDVPARGLQDSLLHRRLLSVVAREPNELDARVARRDRAHHRRRPIAAAVVDEHDLEAFLAPLENRNQPFDQLTDVRLLVVNGNDDRMPEDLAHGRADSVCVNAETTRSTSRSVSCG